MGVRFVKISDTALKYLATSVLEQLKSVKISPAQLKTLNTLILELAEVGDADIEYE
jgi:hypothetical protein